ncbi:stearoyl-CoA desaturase 5 isoform X2 [Oryctolagus cuniculus]|uniref:stearoyl-CoA desaturase 5 isoform X2 n=1 Tax=Oryctolagus cuniculus TaxID=9986 RepID=UPI0038792329
MPGPAADAGQAPFCDADEELRAEPGVAGGGSGGPEKPGARGQRRQQDIVWRNVVLMGLLHLGAVYSLLLIPKAKPLTLLWAYFCFLLTALGVTAGAHRLWSHRSYKAKLPLRIFLAAANSMAFQNDIFEWARDHRAHHKYSETDADPHNARRGFFFSHIGWLLVRKHPDVIEKGRKLDVTDLLADPVVQFQRNHHPFLWARNSPGTTRREFLEFLAPRTHSHGTIRSAWCSCASWSPPSCPGTPGERACGIPTSWLPSSATPSPSTAPGWSTALPTCTETGPTTSASAPGRTHSLLWVPLAKASTITITPFPSTTPQVNLV